MYFSESWSLGSLKWRPWLIQHLGKDPFLAHEQWLLTFSKSTSAILGLRFQHMNQGKLKSSEHYANQMSASEMECKIPPPCGILSSVLEQSGILFPLWQLPRHGTSIYQHGAKTESSNAYSSLMLPLHKIPNTNTAYFFNLEFYTLRIKSKLYSMW